MCIRSSHRHLSTTENLSSKLKKLHWAPHQIANNPSTKACRPWLILSSRAIYVIAGRQTIFLLCMLTNNWACTETVRAAQTLFIILTGFDQLPNVFFPSWKHTSTLLKFTNLQREGQHHVRLGQGVFILLAHVHDWGVVASFELLQFELPSSGHRHALKIGHQQINRWSQLFDVHGLHLSWCKPRKPSTMLPKTGKQTTHVLMEAPVLNCAAT